jgi:hypothetical protein
VNPYVYVFRPWVRRAGLSIVAVASIAITLLIVTLIANPVTRYSWIAERSIWLYLGTLWLGGVKVWTGTMRPVAEVREGELVVRPLHHLRERAIAWDRIRGTEQMIGGDRLIVFYEVPRGPRFVALNLNLVKGRRDFLQILEERLTSMGFGERIVERSRYLQKG